jgi:hypothetical protein
MRERSLAVKPSQACSLLERTLLMRRTPDAAVVAQKDVSVGRLAAGPGKEARKTFIGEGDLTDPAFAQADRDGSAVAVESLRFQARQFGVAAPGQQSRLHETSKVRIAPSAAPRRPR